MAVSNKYVVNIFIRASRAIETKIVKGCKTDVITLIVNRPSYFTLFHKAIFYIVLLLML